MGGHDGVPGIESLLRPELILPAKRPIGNWLFAGEATFPEEDFHDKSVSRGQSSPDALRRSA
jgi:hypothetical protein